MYSLREWSAKGQYFEFEGRRIFYVRQGGGSKPLLVLLHGFPTSSWDWQLIWDELCQRFQVLALDFLGFGTSDKPIGHAYRIGEQASIVEALLEHQKASAFHLLAHDFGDTVAQELMARDNSRDHKRIESVVLTNGGLFPETHRPVLIQRLLMSPLGGWIARLASFRQFKQNFDRICARRLNEADLRTHWQIMNQNEGRRVMPGLIRYMEERREKRTRWVSALQQCRCPKALVNGVEDPISGAHMVQRYQELVSDEYIYRLAGVGHYPQLEDAEGLMQACNAFWSQCGIRQSEN